MPGIRATVQSFLDWLVPSRVYKRERRNRNQAHREFFKEAGLLKPDYMTEDYNTFEPGEADADNDHHASNLPRIKDQ